MKPIDTSLGNLFQAARSEPEAPGSPDAERFARRLADRWVAEGAEQVEAFCGRTSVAVSPAASRPCWSSFPC